MGDTPHVVQSRFVCGRDTKNEGEDPSGRVSSIA